MDLVIGVDIGQQVDPTAIAVAEVSPDERPTFTVRFLERLPLRTPYPDVAKRVAAVAANAAAQVYQPANGYTVRGHFIGRPAQTADLTILTDVTGVGRPVHEIIERELEAADLYRVGAYDVRLIPATFTHGDRVAWAEGGGKSVGKAYLVSRLQALLHTDRIKLPGTREAEALAKELLDYEIRIDQDANEKYGAFRVGTHDDLVTALGLACLEDWRTQPSRQYGGFPSRVGVRGGSVGGWR